MEREQLDEYHVQRLKLMLEDSDEAMEIERLAKVSAPGETPMYSPYGCVITPDGTTYALRVYGTHGAVAALLYPDLAEECGVPLPTGDVDGIPKLAYQGFLSIAGREMPIVQLTAAMMGEPCARWDHKPTMQQIEAFRAFCRANDMDLNTKLRTEHGLSDDDGLISLRKLLVAMDEFEVIDHEKLARETRLVQPE